LPLRRGSSPGTSVCESETAPADTDLIAAPGISPSRDRSCCSLAGLGCPNSVRVGENRRFPGTTRFWHHPHDPKPGSTPDDV